jgi:hypothetical protein
MCLLLAPSLARAQATGRIVGRTTSEDGRPLASVSIVVLGTSRQDATALTSTAPVDVITPQQLRETGAVTINQALSKLHPSFNFPQGQNAVKGQGVRAASLRGVGPARLGQDDVHRGGERLAAGEGEEGEAQAVGGVHLGSFAAGAVLCPALRTV